MSNPMDHLRFDDVEDRQRVEEIIDDWMTHCHGVKSKVIGLMAVQMDLQATVIKRGSAEGRDREDAMYRFFRHIQDQIEKQSGWIQFDYYHPEIDAYEFNRFSGALGDKSDHARWSDLLERFTASGSHQHKWETDPHKPDWKLCECGAGLPPSITADSRQEPEYRECENCGGLGTVMENTDQPVETECLDCEGEGKVDSKGYAPSYAAAEKGQTDG